MGNIIFVDLERWTRKRQLFQKKNGDVVGDIIPVNFKKWKRILPKEKMTPSEFTRSVLGHLLPDTKNKDKSESPKGA